jgi:serine/threonine protein kinase
VGADHSSSTQHPCAGDRLEPNSHDDPGDFPGYKILGESNRGIMNLVYKAEKLDGNRIVAIKTPNPASTVPREEVLARLDTEQDILGTLSHPNIVQLLESFERPRRGFSMEWYRRTEPR